MCQQRVGVRAVRKKGLSPYPTLTLRNGAYKKSNSMKGTTVGGRNVEIVEKD